MPNTPEGPSASAPGSQTPSMAFTAHKPARHPLFRPEGRGCDDACSGFTHVTDRTVAPAPLRTRPLDHARGHSYQRPRHLPRPDSRRPAVLNLSLDLRHDELHLLTTPKQSGRTCATASMRWETLDRPRRRQRRPVAAGHCLCTCMVGPRSTPAPHSARSGPETAARRKSGLSPTPCGPLAVTPLGSQDEAKSSRLRSASNTAPSPLTGHPMYVLPTVVGRAPFAACPSRGPASDQRLPAIRRGA